jgi:hypothetical protein
VLPVGRAGLVLVSQQSLRSQTRGLHFLLYTLITNFHTILLILIFMFRSSLLQAPVITLLSPSVSASQRAATLLSSVFGSSLSSSSSNFVIPDTTRDKLDHVFTSSVPGLSRLWKSVAVSCSVSGTVIHFCSVVKENNNDRDCGARTPFSLLAITEGVGNEECALDNPEERTIASIRKCRNFLASHLSHLSVTTMHVRLNVNELFGRSVTPLDLLKETVSSDGLPLLSIEGGVKSSVTLESQEVPFFKEVVVPFFDYAEYKDGSTMPSQLALSKATRPAVGVYQWPGCPTCIRPLPTASEDHRLPPPSLILHSAQPQDDNHARIVASGIRTARIGYSGGMNSGQIMLQHEDLLGLDVRLCPRSKVSSAFSEAQESLLAGSLGELQSSNVLLPSGQKGMNDDRIGQGDCWVELRANVKRPTGYLRTKRGGSVKQKIASIPDLPYE